MGNPLRLSPDVWQARLSRRIALWVFLSIVAIEAIILVPSVLRRERELLGYLKALSAAQATGLLVEVEPHTIPPEDLLRRMEIIQQDPVILGGALYRLTGSANGPSGAELVGTFGEPPELMTPDIATGRSDRYHRRTQRYDALWEMSPLEGAYQVVIRHDATWVGREFYAFIGRIAGLVVIISLFVTGATLVVLEPMVIAPVLALRRDLMLAGRTIRQNQDARSLLFESVPQQQRSDELGDVAIAFEEMVDQVTAAIEERDRTEQALRESEARFRLLVEQATDALFVVAPGGKFVDVNQQACETLGYTREELLTLSVTNVQQAVSPADLEQFWQLAIGHPTTREGIHVRKDGSSFPVEVRLGRIDMQGRPLLLALARDITERKQVEQTQARLAEVGELAAMIVHEVRNPLTTVLMGLKSCQSLDLPPRSHRRLTFALEESERLQRLLNEILLYARESVLELETLNLTHLLATLTQNFGEHPLAADHRIQWQGLTKPTMVQGDRDKLTQVFINLLNNAWEAVLQGESITCTVTPLSPHQVQICIRNGGDPIPPEILPKLTQPFFTTKPTGNGLGLAITRRIVEAHGGTLHITSSAAEGTRVTVTLPAISTGAPADGVDQ
ncbi:PAS domain S-box protein [Leptolyngbya sp. PCC 6406]|uniref:PAS domain S-box protein n=1 Tax=Leptolyngbya sp. PCC 6406 TaxID=1173264 RepID=UPI0002ABE89C|nr:PAS domain S-box protein [Leptolyngbya sp. PCC 6406]